MKKIGILTVPRAENYGSTLQAYAMTQLIEKIEQDYEMIDYVSPFLVGRYKLWVNDFSSAGMYIKSIIRNVLILHKKLQKKKKFKQFQKKIKFSIPTVYTSRDIEKYKAIIVGGDQIWNVRITNYDKSFFLDFADSETRKMAFGVSLGFSDRKDCEIEFYNQSIRNFDSIAVRECYDVDFITNLNDFNQKINYVLDPTLLVENSVWLKLLQDVKPIVKEKYLLVYMFGNNIDVIKTAQKISSDFGIQAYLIEEGVIKVDKNGFKRISGVGPIEFLKLISTAEYIVTNSFHGMAFSIALHKQFTCVPYAGTEERFLSLLDVLKISNCIYDEKNIKANTIDYKKLDNILSYEREKAISLLNEFCSLI